MTVPRRDVLKVGVFGGAALLLPLERTVGAQSALPPRLASSKLPAPFTVPFSVPPVLRTFRTDSTTDYYKVHMMAFQAEVIPGLHTVLWGYNGSVPGPTVHVNQGRRTVMRQINNLPRQHPTLGFTPWTSVHLHGAPSDPQYDGYASDVTNPGQYKDYRYANATSARTLWYHDHGVFHTAEDAQMGLAAQYHIFDQLERSLPIPHGDYDVPLIVSDAMFQPDGSLLIDNHDGSGFFGDVILVNGRPWPAMKVKRRKYRFRLLNASVSRSHNLFLDSGDAMTVIGTDAGLVEHPIRVTSLRAAMAERYEIVIDFSKYPVGRRIVLGNRSPKNNINYVNVDKVMAFDVVADSFDPRDNSIPDTLNPGNPTMALQVRDAVKTRVFEFNRGGGQFTINGRTWEDVVESGFTRVEASPRSDSVELWVFRNSSGGWFHPVHPHLVEFKIVDRNGKPPFPYEVGPKDVVYAAEGDTIRVLIRFEGRGKYMIHCHNMVHEDHDMMTQFEVIDPARASFDPFSVPARALPEGLF
ncbi:MAG: multicopper oxidase family protein [Pseudonocardiales bacterium]|nr:multicopper oxidase family protein [Pseudonocardiales bacterium]